jgi:hypothetical protein
MKRKDLIRHLEAHGCELLREGGNHTICFAQKVRKIFVFDIELQRSSQIRAQGCFNPGECWFPEILNSVGVGELLQSSSVGTLVIPGLETLG